MPTSPQPTQIYRITHFSSLSRISADGMIHCSSEMAKRGPGACVNIAHAHIQQRRARTRVRIGPGGTLHDYVAFYFAPRSPMLYAIHRNNVSGYDEGQAPIVYLVSTAQAVRRACLPFIFTDGHAVMALSNAFSDLADLDKVDWPIMRSKYWNDTQTDPDRSRRRQAEFLVHQSLPWALIHEIGVISQVAADQVNATLDGAQHLPVVSVRPEWYYEVREER